MPILQIEATLQSSHLRHQYGIFSSKSQTSFLRNATRVGSEEGRLFSQAIKSCPTEVRKITHQVTKMDITLLVDFQNA